MSTLNTLSPERPLRVVWDDHDTTHADDTSAAPGHQKGRWAAFLVAKDLLLGYLKTAGQTAAEAFHRLGITSSIQMVRRAAGWLFGGFSLVRRGLTTAGVRPGLAWVLSSQVGQAAVQTVTRWVTTAVTTVVRTVARAAGWCLRLFGRYGTRAAQWLEQKTTTIKKVLTSRVVPVDQVIGSLLVPGGLAMQAVRTWAKGKLITQALQRFLPSTWNVLGRVLANLIVLPGSLRRKVVQFAAGLLTSRSAGISEEDAATEPQDDPTPPTAPATPSAATLPTGAVAEEREAEVVDLASHRPVEHPVTAQVTEQVSEPAIQLDALGYPRYPASKRSRNAKRKR